jgi:hypothetical protein
MHGLRFLLLAVTFACGLAACRGDADRLAEGQCPTLLPDWTTPAEGRSGFRVMLLIKVHGQEITVENNPVPRDQLSNVLRSLARMSPSPTFAFDPRGAADCETATAIRDEIHHAADCRGAGACGQGPAREWQDAPLYD